jgi:CheY-like chemotaxis protein
VAIGLAARAHYIRLLFALSRIIFRFYFACSGEQASCWKPWPARLKRSLLPGRYTGTGNKGPSQVEQVGVLLVDDDVTSQQALKSVLDSEGWRVRIVPKANEALGELATGSWNLAIVNVALADPRGPLFAILRELAQAQIDAAPIPEPPNPDVPNSDATNSVADSAEGGSDTPPQKRIRVLFLVPLLMATEVQPILEREGLPHSPKPYHLHDFLERVSELLLESGAIAEPIRGVGGFAERKVRRRSQQRFGRGTRPGAMFAPREDYSMTEEEMAEYERQEEEQRKKRQKDQPPGSSY